MIIFLRRVFWGKKLWRRASAYLHVCGSCLLLTPCVISQEAVPGISFSVSWLFFYLLIADLSYNDFPSASHFMLRKHAVRHFTVSVGHFALLVQIININVHMSTTSKLLASIERQSIICSWWAEKMAGDHLFYKLEWCFVTQLASI